jgi:hypothetical protein
MTSNTYPIDPADAGTLEALIDGVNARSTPAEDTLRSVLRLHRRPFRLVIDLLNRPVIESPVVDLFTFDLETDDLLVYSDEAPILIDALIEMAMYMQGFATLIGVDEHWKVQVTIGCWRYVREAIKESIGLEARTDKAWAIMLGEDDVKQLDGRTFMQMILLAGCPDVEVLFPPGAAPDVEHVYKDVSRVIEVVSRSITLADHVEFNQRLHRALELIESRLTPSPNAPEDDTV